MQDLDFVAVHAGEDVEVAVNMNQQVQIPIEGIYRNTVPDTTPDCESDKRYSFDQNLTDALHQSWNTTYACTVPFLGGLDSPFNFTICNNPSMYDTTQLDVIVYNATQTFLKSCKKSVISFGHLHVYNISAGRIKPDPPRNLGARVTFRFPDYHTRTEEYVKYDFAALLGSVGGYLGLYLGASLWQIMDVLPWLSGK